MKVALDILERINFKPKTTADVKIATFLDKKNIIFLQEQSRDAALSRLVESLFFTGKIQDKDEFYNAILERENIVSTGVGMGIAIPHAKKIHYNNFFIAIGVQKVKGLEWGSLDNSLVRLILMIGGPEDRQNDYLKILSKLTTIIRNENERKLILQADSPDQIIKIFKDY